MRLEAGQVRQPEKEAAQIAQRREYGRLADPLAGAHVDRLRKACLESDRLLGRAPFELARLGRTLKTRKRLRHAIDGCGVAPFGLCEILEIVPLNPLICPIVLGHVVVCLSESQFREGVGLPPRRGGACTNWTSQS